MGNSGATRTTVGGLTVVGRAHDDEEHLGACLSSIRAAAGWVPVPVEVVVVLDACTDASVSVLPVRARAVTVDLRNVGAARAAEVHDWSAAANARVGGSRPLLVHEDVDLVERCLQTGASVHRSAADPVVTSARVSTHPPDGFEGQLSALELTLTHGFVA